jgi:predicted HTH transcriptional regulator
MNSRRHESILRNPLIAGTFHRTGAVEIWGRGTNRDIEECERWGVEPPSFEVVTGSRWDDPRQAAQLEETYRTTAAGRRVLDRHGGQDD